MEVESVNHSLELEENINLHKKGWIIQRILWVILFLFILAGALGFFGNGPVSKEKLLVGDLTLEYEKYARFQAETEIKVHNSSGKISKISLPQSYLNHFHVENIIPQPLNSRSSNGTIEYSFDTSENSTIVILLMPKEVGKVREELVIEGKQFQLSQFIYP